MSLFRNAHGANRSRERGAAIVEMAVVAPILIILLLGIWTVARAYNVKNTMDHAVREGARYAATVVPWDGTPSASDASVRAVIDGELGAAAISAADIDTVCIVLVTQGNNGCDDDGTNQVINAPADLIAVRIEIVDYPLDFVFWTFRVDFASQATARHES